METQLLATKLFVPDAPPGLVCRPRLMENLQTAFSRRLVLVSAPPGFGKTTVVSQWVHQNRAKARTAWLSLDEGDNDVLRFWDYFVAGVQQLVPGAGEATLPMLRSAEPTTDTALNALINDVADVKDHVTIVLDDFHVITAEPVYSTLTYVIEHLPPNMHIVISTRVDPPLPLARFRGRGTMIEIGADDLRFTDEEAAALLRETRAALAAGDVSALNARTEGWAVGLKLAALSLPAGKDVKSFVEGFTGSQRYVADYLIEEVLRRQPEEVRDFLVKTSVLERLTAPLCEFVSGRQKGQEMLVRLEGTLGGFLVALDQTRQSYRYHHLFGELLRNQLALKASTEEVADLNLRACQWHEAHGLPDGAVHYALAAKHWERAAGLISAQSGGMMMSGDMEKLIKWIGTIPNDVLQAHEPLHTVYAICLLTVARLNEAEAALTQLEARAQGNTGFQGTVTALQATLMSRRGEYARAIELGERAFQLVPPDDLATRSRVYFIQGVSHTCLGQMEEAEVCLSVAYGMGQQSGDLWAGIGGAAYLAQVYWVGGRLSEAVALDERAISLAGLAPAGANAR
jgi:LuxR family maltose regulon positive regulatory protein